MRNFADQGAVKMLIGRGSGKKVVQVEVGFLDSSVTRIVFVRVTLASTTTTSPPRTTALVQLISMLSSVGENLPANTSLLPG